MAGCSNTISAKSPKFQRFIFSLYITLFLKFEKKKKHKNNRKRKEGRFKRGTTPCPKREFSESEKI